MSNLELLIRENACLIAHNDLHSGHYTLNDVMKRINQQQLFPCHTGQKTPFVGGDILLTNTFDANRFRLNALGMGNVAYHINLYSAQILKNSLITQNKLLGIGGCMGPIGMNVPYAEAVNGYAEQASGLAEGGCDFLWLESFNSLNELDAAIQGCVNSSHQLPLVATIAFQPTPSKQLSATKMAQHLSQRPLFAFGADSGAGDTELLRTISRMATYAPRLVIKADVKMLFKAKKSADSVQQVVEYTAEAQRAGIQIIGIGTHTTAAHIQAMMQIVRNSSPC